VIAFFEQLLPRVRALPGVESASVIVPLPLTAATWSRRSTMRTTNAGRREASGANPHHRHGLLRHDGHSGAAMGARSINASDSIRRLW
jgi:hypothetical protein